MKPRPVLGLTMGDPAGIGPELCLRALHEPAVLAKCVPVLFGDAGMLKRVAGRRFRRPGSGNGLAGRDGQRLPRFAGRGGGDVDPVLGCCVASVEEWERRDPPKEPLVVDCAAVKADAVRFGRIAAACGKAAFRYIEEAIHAAKAGRIAGVATAPIHKEALRRAGISYPGHTEIFTALTGARRSCMMLQSEVLTVSMVTTHIGYEEVPRRLSVKRILDVIELTADAVRRIRRRPARLGICGLNPHAGEHGLFGRKEEERFVEPAVKRARQGGIQVEGPLAPDAAFTTVQRKRFDAVVTLYHDQGHIPFKMLAFDTGVNITLGLPIVRTSVDHGTAFDIAGKGTADPQSLFAAIGAAVELINGTEHPPTRRAGRSSKPGLSKK